MDKRDFPLYALLVIFAVAGLFIINKETQQLASNHLLGLEAAAARSATPAPNYQKITESPTELQTLTDLAKQKNSKKDFTPKTLQGTLYVIYDEDGFDKNKNPYKTIMVSGSEVYEIENISLTPIDPKLSGTKVELTGVLESGRTNDAPKILVNLDSRDLQKLRAPKHAPKNWQPYARNAPCGGNFCALVILLDTTSNPGSLPLPQDIHDYIFDGRIKSFFGEQSYGAMDYEGLVTDWIATSSQNINIWNTPYEAAQYIASNNIDVSTFDQVVFVVNGGPDGGDGGTASVGPMYFEVGQNSYTIPVARIGFSNYQNNANLTMANGNLSRFDYIYSHETGHNLGAGHDNLLNCQKVPTALPSECIHVEYGNNYSAMGGGYLGGHFSFLNKLYLGWITTTSITFSAAGSQALSPTETVDPTFLGLDYNMNSVPEYVFERRSLAGVDTPILFPNTNLEGAFVYRLTPSFGFGNVTSNPASWNFNLVDTTPDKYSSTWPNALYDAVLKIPQSFSDTQLGRGFRQNANGNNNLIDIFPIPMESNSCTQKPVKVFEPALAADVFPGQIGEQRWPITNVGGVANMQSQSADVNDPSAEALIYKNIVVFNDDKIGCGPSDFTFKFIHNGVELPLLSSPSTTYEPWSGPHYELPFAMLPVFGLTYGTQTVTLEVTKLNDGSVFSKDLVFELIP